MSRAIDLGLGLTTKELQAIGKEKFEAVESTRLSKPMFYTNDMAKEIFNIAFTAGVYWYIDKLAEKLKHSGWDVREY